MKQLIRSARGRWQSGALAVLLGLLALPAAQAQQRVQVVARTLEQSWSCPPGRVVRIRAEKASVQVRGWDRPTVQVTLRLSARHPERAVAEQDLPVAQYRLEQNGNVLDLVNLFVLPAGAPAVRSDLRAEYTVWMPAGNPLQVVNAYGQTELADLTGRLTLEQSFGQITLRNLRGTLAATARYADLTATNVQADFTCQANRSAVQLLGLGGSCFVRNYYGSVRVQPTPDLRQLTVEADRTEVVISAPQPERFAYQLSVQQGALAVPLAYAAAKKGSASRASLTTAPASPPRPLVRVSTSYASLTLQMQLLSTQF
ncbi:hypothetical protein ACFQ48_06865 [Hymenobacter caeli]|uniref:Adhesin domain-containing protein n=1 Tax=Hymenobacter caeli TaxID=2735894 RepID=A0ABX2FR97_9BACT|nr:hypothetical protein [Hymenobacter caeli]NRT18904.1 hypothetical protein [Hymenobacter caeli]